MVTYYVNTDQQSQSCLGPKRKTHSRSQNHATAKTPRLKAKVKAKAVASPVSESEPDSEEDEGSLTENADMSTPIKTMA